MTGVNARYSSYLSKVAAREPDGGDGAWLPIEGTLLFADISGFTNLSERLALKGRIGAEELTTVLDRVFGKMIDIAISRGGSLIKFGGDALLLMFDTEDHALQACTAGVEMRKALREASQEPTSVGRLRLSMSVGIHSGTIDYFFAGTSHRELIVSGPVASMTTVMEGTADAGEIVMSGATKALVPQGFAGSAKGDGWLLRKRTINHDLPDLDESAFAPEQDLSRFIPVALREHLSSGFGDSEHRVATVGFLKFKGVDALLENEGPDALAAELHGLVNRVQDAVDAEEVTFLASDIDENGGKFILASGVPTSRHDDEGRVLRAMRQILDTDSRLKLQGGVNRGHVFSGQIGPLRRRTYTVMGDTVNLAARMMAAAGPGQLYSTPGALDKASTLFRTELLEPLHVKGKEKAITAYDVCEETGIRPPDMVRELPFHGREAEMSMIVTIVTTCARVGRGGIMTITGDTGIGKSRLIAEVLEECPGMDTMVIQGEPTVSDNPYWAFRDPMRGFLGIERTTQEQMAARLLAALERDAPDLVELAPLLGDVLHIEVPETPTTAVLDRKFRPEKTAEVFAALLSGVDRGPFAVIVEDGHWLDEASLDLVERLGEAAASRPWTVIVTARPGERGFQPLGDEIRLGSLGDGVIRTIAIEATAAAPLRPDQLDSVVARADGSPLFLSEILKVLREGGEIDDLPDSIEAIVSQEIDTLRPLPRKLLRYSSVLGRSFRRVVLDKLLEPEDMELDTASEQELAEFLEPDGQTRIRFRHAVVHSAAYFGLPFHRRRTLHARAGDVIEELAGEHPEAVAEFLAGHYSQSGRYDKAWEYSRIAGDKARSAYANSEAAVHYRRAIDAANHLGDVNPSDIALIWTELGDVVDESGQFAEARTAFSRASSLTMDPLAEADIQLRRAKTWMGTGNLSQAKRSVTLGKKRLGDMQATEVKRAMARLYAYEASILGAAGNMRKALDVSRRAIDLATESGEDEALARALRDLDGINYALGRDEPRRGEEAIEIYHRLGQEGHSAGVMNNLGAYEYLDGNWVKAVDWYQRALVSSDRSGDVFFSALTRANIAEVLVGQRKFDEAAPLLNEARRVYEATDSTVYMPLVSVLQVRNLLGQGRFDEAIEMADKAVSDDLTDQQFGGELKLLKAEAVAMGSDAVKALKIVAEVEESSRVEAAELMRVKAIALREADEAVQARQVALTSLEAARTSGDLYAEMLALELVDELARRSGFAPEPTDSDRLRELRYRMGVIG